MNSQATLSQISPLLLAALADPEAAAARAFCAGLRPDPDLTVWEWADANRVLPQETSAEPGPWRTDRVPHAREIMQELSPSSVAQEVIFMAGTQVAKTEIGNNFIGFIMDVAPGPTMMVLPTVNTGKRSSKTRIAKMIDSTPSLKRKIGELKSRDTSNTASLKEFPGGVLAIAGANSAAELKSMPVKNLFEDELDEYPDDVDGQGPAEELAEKRTDTFARRKIYKASTPTVKGHSKITKAFERGDQRLRYVPCPHCDVEHVLRWENMRWEVRKAYELRCTECGAVSDLPAPAAVEEGAAPAVHTCPHCEAQIQASDETVIERDTDEVLWAMMQCPSCDELIEERHKTDILARGRWIAQKPGDGRVVSFKLPALYSPLGWFSWVECVRLKIKSNADPTGKLEALFCNTVLAEAYADRGLQMEVSTLKQRAEPYRLRTVPSGALMLVAGVDVQGDRLEVEVDGYGRGEESWLIAYEVIHGDPMQADVWESLDEFLDLQFQRDDGNVMKVLATAVDSGYLTQAVYAWCRPRAHRMIFPVKGVQQEGKAVIGRASKQDIDWRGRSEKDGIDLFPVGVDTAKTTLQKRMGIELPGPGYMHFPLGLPDSYYKGLTSERKVRRWVRGYERMVWEKDAGAANEPFDLKVYAYAAAIRAGLTRANWDKLEAYFKATGDLFVTAARAAQAAVASDGTPAKAAAPEPVQPAEDGAADVATESSEGEALAVMAADAREQDKAGRATAPRETPKKPVWIQPRRDWFRR